MAADNLSRRDFLRSTAAAAGGLSAILTGCEQKPTAPTTNTRPRTAAPSDAERERALQAMLASQDPGNIVNALSGNRFKTFDDSGQERVVTIRDIAPQFAGHCTSVSFGLCRCQDYCPTINGFLGDIGRENDNVKSLVIAAKPAIDGRSFETHKDYKDELTGIMRGNQPIILYPLDESGALSEAKGKELQMRFGGIPNPNAKIHTTTVTLYGADGAKLRDARIVKGRDNENSVISGQWNQIISSTGRPR